MGFQYQTADIVAGTVLVVERIESQNFVTGSFGWAIYADGNAEFNDVTARGVVIVGDENAQHIMIAVDPVFPFTPRMTFWTGASEDFPGQIQTSDPSNPQLWMTIEAPFATGALGDSVIFLATQAGLPGRLTLTSGDVAISAATSLTFDRPALLDTAWQAVARVNSWIDFAGSRARYFKDAAGIVHVNGVIANGTAALIGTLPAGYRPAQSHEFGLPSAAAFNVLCSVRVNTNGDISVLSNLASAQVRLPLDFSFPTLT